MRNHYIYILTILAIIISSCEKESNIKLPDVDPKLSVYGFLSPEDTMTNIIVKHTVPYFGKTDWNQVYMVTNAEVKITNNGSDYLLPYDPLTQTYHIDSSELKIIPGSEYFIEVSSNDYPTVTSSATIPLHINSTLKLLGVRRLPSSGTFVFNVKWEDNINEVNYYRLTGYQDYGNYSNSIYESVWGCSLNNGPLDDDDIFLFDDTNWNGQTKIREDLNTYQIAYDTIIPVHIMLLNTDIHYYKYHKFIKEAELYYEDPFAEPVMSYTNINNGTGIFCAYRKYELIYNWDTR